MAKGGTILRGWLAVGDEKALSPQIHGGAGSPPRQQLPCLFSLLGDWLWWSGRTSEESVFLRQGRHRVFSPEGLPPPADVLSALWQEGSSPQGLRALAGPPPVFCSWGCHGGKGREQRGAVPARARGASRSQRGPCTCRPRSQPSVHVGPVCFTPQALLFGQELKGPSKDGAW